MVRIRLERSGDGRRTVRMRGRTGLRGSAVAAAFLVAAAFAPGSEAAGAAPGAPVVSADISVAGSNAVVS